VTAHAPDTKTWNYGFGALGGACPVTNPNTNAGRNGNRTTMTVANTTTAAVIEQRWYCHDNADRLQTTGTGTTPGTAGLTTFTYDDRGNALAADGTTFTYDQTDRHVGSTRGAVNDRVVRDPDNRIITRTDGTLTTRYGYGGPGDSPSLVTNSAGVIQERVLPLTGGVTLMKRAAGGDIWSYSNLHGDTTATATPTGIKIGATQKYQADGKPITNPLDLLTGTHEYGWLGQHQRPTNTMGGYIEMGTRIYIPTLGRFLSVDPIEGGNTNNYTYPNDPVNGFDLDGLRNDTGGGAGGLEPTPTNLAMIAKAGWSEIEMAFVACSNGKSIVVGSSKGTCGGRWINNKYVGIGWESGTGGGYESISDWASKANEDRKAICKVTNWPGWSAQGAISTNVGKKIVTKVAGKRHWGRLALPFGFEMEFALFRSKKLNVFYLTSTIGMLWVTPGLGFYFRVVLTVVFLVALLKIFLGK
jgi:RHS repeat-associated protein